MSATEFFSAYRDEGLILQEPVANVNADLPSVFVSPLGTEVPDDALLEYITFDGAKDFLDAGTNTRTRVVLVREDQAPLLELICNNAELLKLNVFAMYGVPGSDYKPWFDEATFKVERLSYSPFVSELRIASDVEKAVEANRPKSTIETEQKTYTRRSGAVKSIARDQVVVGDEDDVDFSEIDA